MCIRDRHTITGSNNKQRDKTDNSRNAYLTRYHRETAAEADIELFNKRIILNALLQPLLTLNLIL